MPLNETPSQTMARVSRELRSSARPTIGGGYQADVSVGSGPLSGGVFAAGAPVTGQPQAVGANVGVGPLSAQFVQPTFKGAQPSYGVGFNADEYFGANVMKTPQGMQYGVNAGPVGVSYNPARKDLSVMGTFERRFADGGPVLTSKRIASSFVPPEEQGAISPSMEGVIEGAQAVGRGFGPALQATGEYITSTRPGQVLSDVGTLAGGMYEAAKQNPAEFIGGMLPGIGNIYSLRDIDELKGKIAAARAAGDEATALRLEKFAPLAAVGAAAPFGAGAAVGAVTKAAERAAVSGVGKGAAREGIDAASDISRLIESAPDLDEAARIARQAEPPHNPDTVGAEARAQQPITGGNEDLQFTALEREARELASVRLSAEERNQISQLATETKINPEKDAVVDPKAALKAYRKKKAKYPESEGWAPFEVVGFERDARGNVKFNDEGLPELKIKQEAYEFHRAPGETGVIRDGKWDQGKVEELATKLADEVLEVADREAKGDKNAKVIMAARKWYSTMRDRLRQEYGGFADVLADVLGTTSAQTNVRQNWENTIEVLSQFSRGAYDRALGKLDDWLEAGGEMGSAGTKDGTGYINGHLRDLKAALPDAKKQAEAEGLTGKAFDARAKEIAFQKAQEGEFPLITKADGKTLFNANSPQTMMALLDEFRKRKVGDAPKTPNFTGNLIGYSDKATIDVWAARLLRRLSGRSRLIPDAESGVGGGYLGEALPSGIQVGGEFGFGQEVFQKAAEKLRQDPRFKDLGDDDLQAIAWFLEKETWGQKGYTTKAGEGGSLELEANFAGVSDREALRELRSIADTDPTFAERVKLKKEIADPKAKEARDAADAFYQENSWILDYKTAAQRRNAVMELEGLDRAAAAERADALYSEVREAQNTIKRMDTKVNRLATLEERAKSVPAQARASLDEMQAIARRFTGGLSPDRPDAPAMPQMFVEDNKAIIGVLDKDPEVMMMKATPSTGRYIDPQGQIFDEPAFDLEFVTRQNFDPNPTFRTIVEQAKKRNQESTFLSEVIEAGTNPNANPGLEIYFTKKVGPDVVDRVTQTINQLGVDAGFTFVTDFRAKNRAAGGENVGEYVGIRLQYIPEFGKNGVDGIPAAQKKMLEAIDTVSAVDGVSSARYVEYDTQVLFRDNYDGYLAGNVPDGRRAAWTEQPRSEGDQAADRGAGVLKRAVGGAVVHRRRGGPADAGDQKGQAGIKSAILDLREAARERNIYRPKLAYLIRQMGGADHRRSQLLANNLLSDDLDDLVDRLKDQPRAVSMIKKLTAKID